MRPPRTATSSAIRCVVRTGALALFLGLPSDLRATDYHFDSRSGNDDRDGLSATAAWRSLARLQSIQLRPGDRVLLHAGSTWSESLRLTAEGDAGRPIVVQAFGEGPRPRIEGTEEHEDAVLLRNCRHLEIRDLEITHRGAGGDRPRRGLHLVADNCGTVPGIVVRGLFIHDIRGTQKRKDNGGIIFRTLGRSVPSRFEGLLLERNIVWRVDRSGIAADSYHANRTRWFPSTGVVIRDNWVGDAGGDGIVPWATDGCLVEHNVVQGANERAGSYNAGIWPWSTDNTVLRLNRASGVKTLLDGQGFDSDYNCRNTLLEYNLSHDNEGGFLLICSPGKRKPEENLGNQGTVARHNISRHDRARTFHVSAAENTVVRENAVYIGPDHDVQAVLLTDWSGWARGLVFRDNLLHSDGIARYGHQVSRADDGSYGIASGWGPARAIEFGGNRYLGRHESPPPESEPTSERAPRPIAFDDWPGPQFDPRRPETFADFVEAHREWMVRLMKRQFGTVRALSLGDRIDP